MRFGKHCSNVGFEGLKVSNSCSLRSLAILLRNKFEFAVYGIDAACGRYCRGGIPWPPVVKKGARRAATECRPDKICNQLLESGVKVQPERDELHQ
jgi:hypothetical protein